MRFTINIQKFLQALEQAVAVAATVDKEAGEEYTTDKLSLGTTKNELFIIALSTTAAIKITLSNDDGYVCHHIGHVTTTASELLRQVAALSAAEKLELETSFKGLVVRTPSDPDTMSVLRSFEVPIQLLPLAKSYSRTITIDRTTFLHGLKRVGFAMAYEETKKKFMCLFFEATKDSLRFVAGSGARFVVDDMTGQKLTNAKSRVSVIFPKKGIAQIVKVFKNVESEQLTVKYANESVANKTPAQITVECAGTTLAWYGIDTSIKYPDVNIILKHLYPYVATTTVEDWRLPAAAILATMQGPEVIHNTRVQADLLHGYLTLTTNARTHLQEKVHFALGPFQAAPDEKIDAPSFTFNTWYLKEVLSRGNKKGKVTFHFENQEQSSESDNGRRMKPILVEFPEAHLADGSKEQFHMFFSVSTKW